MGPPLPLLLLLLLPPRPVPAAPAPRGRPLPGRLGCLFEDDLCGSSEACVDDGVFGRCQKVPVMHTFRYEVSPEALQHLRVTLQRLSRAGLTWQDGYTQRVMAQELTNLPRAYPRHLETSGPARTLPQGVDSTQLHGLENEMALAKTLQRYLPQLGILPQATSSSVKPRVEPQMLPAEVTLAAYFLLSPWPVTCVQTFLEADVCLVLDSRLPQLP
ncbi:receptor-type tyrosine-protein phosphatase N2 [Thomomys bottae]